MSTPGRFAFLPHVQTQLAADATATASNPRLCLSYDLHVQADGADVGDPVAISAELRGPGDVQSLQRTQISRIEPEPGLRGFEPNYFPLIEFTDPDLPWRYSLDVASQTRKNPWLVLIVLKSGEFEFLPQGQRPLPVIQVYDTAISLPDLAQSWAFAHAQVNLSDTGPPDVSGALSANAASGFSRLMCPRKLEERQSYWMFLVPAYRAGAAAGRGEAPPAGTTNETAWAGGDMNVQLPIYFESRFSTDSAEDFEELLRRLRGLSPAELLTALPAAGVSAANPGYYENYSKPGATFEPEAALVPPGRGGSSFSTDDALAGKLSNTLKIVIAGETGDAGGEDPLVGLPAYGFRFRRETEAVLTRAKNNHWFDRVNLDLKLRHAASLGAQTVARNQELFARLCWDQYEEVREANLQLARLQSAQELVKRLTTRRVDLLPADTILSLAQPLQHIVPRAVGDVSIGSALRAAGVPLAYASRTLRRQAAKRPTRVNRQARSSAGPSIPDPAIPGDRYQGVTRRAGARAGSGDRLRRLRSVEIRERRAAGPLAARLAPLLNVEAFAGEARPKGLAVTVRPFSSEPLASRLTLAIQQLPAIKARSIIQGLDEQEIASLDPVYRCPIVPLPLSQFLEEFAPDALLTDVAKIPQNTVSVFEENRQFVEAFLVGANHAMQEELRWREFPTDMRGTIFRRFWDRAQPYDGTAGDDISQIHEWSGLIGTHYGPADIDRNGNVVFVIKGEIVRKLGHPVVVLNEAPAASPDWVSGAGRDLHPVFFGKIGPDALYVGFDVALADIPDDRSYLIIYEPMGRLRFGLDVATHSVREQRTNFDTRSLAFPIAPLSRSYDDVTQRSAKPTVAAPDSPATWNDLSWVHMSLTDSGHVDFERDISVSDGGQPQLWTAAKTSASVARSFWQKPLAGVLPLDRLM